MAITKISAAMTDLDGAVTINNSGADADFIVESDDHTHMLFVDAGNNAVGIKNDSPHDTSWGADGADTAQLSIGNTSSGSSYGVLHLLGHNTQATRYSIGAGDGMLYLAYDDVNAAHRLKVHSDGDFEVVDGDIRMASGHGIDFALTGDGSGTDSSELLDDYEEGTWTPVIKAVSGTSSISFTNNQAGYTKVGRLVLVQGYFSNIVMTDLTSGTYAVITGLPYTPAAYADFHIGYHRGGDHFTGGYVQSGSDMVFFVDSSGVEIEQGGNHTMTAFMFNVTYVTS